MTMSERSSQQPAEAREHRLCPACGQYGVAYPAPGDGGDARQGAVHCVACGTTFPYVEECVYCGQPVFLTTSWDEDRQGPPQHPECYPGELQSF